MVLVPSFFFLFQTKSIYPGSVLPKSYWAQLENRKRFFLNLAEELGFDPSDPNGWDTVSADHIKAKKVRALSPFKPSAHLFNIFQSMDQAEGLLRAYGGLHNALQQTFPKLPLSGTTNNFHCMQNTDSCSRSSLLLQSAFSVCELIPMNVSKPYANFLGKKGFCLFSVVALCLCKCPGRSRRDERME